MTDADDPDRRYRAPALEKGLDVLELMAARGVPLTPSQISTALGRSVSELFRMIQVLEFRGYVAQAPDGDGLILTNKLFALGMTRGPAKALLEAAPPIMRRLSAAIGQSCHLAVASGEQMVVVARIEAPGDQGFSVRVGYRRPLVESTSGLVLYAFQPESVRQDWAARLRPVASPAAWSAFEAGAAAARADAYVQAPSNVTKHVIDLSAPVLGPEGVAAALTSPYIETPAALPIPDTIAAIQAATAEISGELAGG